MKTLPESQNIEWKLMWKDDYLKWVCGFANAQGGRIYIGIDNKGKVVGVMLDKDSRARRYEMERAGAAELASLMEDIPNKIQAALSLVVEVNLLSHNGFSYIEINVPPSATPISYKGEYYYRSGSTQKVLTGTALNNFLLSRSGSQWDAAAVPGISVDDLDRESFDIFRREAVRSSRMKQEDIDMSQTELLDKLGLLSEGQLTRAAVLLFHRNPERVSRGCRVRVGMFSEDAEILYQDEVQGSLFIIADRVVDLIYLKYLKASIHYEKETRVETYPYPREAIREIIFNALIHSNWSENNDIQVYIDAESIRVSNCCILPSGWSIETLLGSHRSHASNPGIANAFQRAGYVEVWGRGIAKIMAACRRNGNPSPEYTLEGMDLSVRIQASPKAYIASPASRHFGDEGLAKKILEEIQRSGNINTDTLAATLQLPPAAVRQVMLALMGGAADTVSKSGVLMPKGDVLMPKSDILMPKGDVLMPKNDVLIPKGDVLASQVLSILRHNGSVYQADIAAACHCSQSTVQRQMSRMSKAGLIQFRRNKGGGHWVVLVHDADASSTDSAHQNGNA